MWYYVISKTNLSGNNITKMSKIQRSTGKLQACKKLWPIICHIIMSKVRYVYDWWYSVRHDVGSETYAANINSWYMYVSINHHIDI